MDLKILQQEVHEWTEHNFPGAEPYRKLLGVVEEVGELSHAHLKELEGIRGNQDHTANAKDAVGDIIIFLTDYCNSRGFDMNEILTDVWSEVKQRDWIKYPTNGRTE